MGDAAGTTTIRPDPFMPGPPEVDAPYTPPNQPYTPPNAPQSPFAPGPTAPMNDGPMYDEPALRDREIAVQQREDALNRRIAQRRQIQSTTLTDKDVEGQIVSEYAISGFDAFRTQPNIDGPSDRALRCITICVIVLRNGFPIVGTSVSAAPENYDANVGHQEAKADALNKLWAVEEYALRNRLMGLEVPFEEDIPPVDPVEPGPRL